MMAEQKLFDITGTIMGLGPNDSYPQRLYYKHIWIRESNERETTIRDVSTTRELSTYLSPGQATTLYFVPSPSGHKFLFAIDAGPQHADAIDAVARDQAKARRLAILWLIGSIPLCLVLIGFLLMALTIRGLILLGKAPKPADMRAYLAAHRAAG
jgi:hypothetical protein